MNMASTSSSRPKRKAAEKAQTIVEIDSDEEESPKKKRKRLLNDSDFNLEQADQIEEKKGDKVNKNKRRVEAKPKSPKDPKPKRGRKKIEKGIKNESASLDLSDDIIDGPCVSKKPKEDNSSLPVTSAHCKPPEKRNSFWARRKVWSIPELLAETTNIAPVAAQNIVQLFEQENTIPFICRYRRDLVDHITPERLRDIKTTYGEIVNLRKKAENIITHLEKEENFNDEIRTEMLCAKTAEELEFLYAPYKPASKGSLAERAKALGLEEYADRLLFGDAPQVHLESLVQTGNNDLDTSEKVLNGICNIIIHNIGKHTGVLEEIRRLQKVHRIRLQSTQSKNTEKKSSKDAEANNNMKNNKNSATKYEIYFNFENDVRFIKPHQILAINRGEKSKFLNVKLLIPDHLKFELKRYVRDLYMNEGLRYELRMTVFEKSFEECYAKKLKPLLTKQVRADLNDVAQKASIDVFAKNLKQLLLLSPLRGDVILGIDPGFTNGCKLAVISEAAQVLETGVMYPHTKRGDLQKSGYDLAKMLTRNNCKIIALGNGTACRETEMWLTHLINTGVINARYCIVSEQGASIYSVSPIAKKEFPNMDPNEISAVSIARRLNDPLSEYVKIEPQHIGVGMYQHDVNEKILSETLNEVVSECVSYVGVDINTASLSLLKYVAGLSEKKAEKIIQHRTEKGLFQTRKDLKEVKSIGEKTFVQCAGFIRIEPGSLGEDDLKNPLDCTWVHPEYYDIAKKLIKNCKINLKDIGKLNFIESIKKYRLSNDIQSMSDGFKVPKERLGMVFEALERPPLKDYRSEVGNRPMFKEGITQLADLSVGDHLTGAVTNITHFGAFVDVGVECDGLIHSSHMNGAILSIGDRVNTSVITLDKAKRRIGLHLENLMTEECN